MVLVIFSLTFVIAVPININIEYPENNGDYSKQINMINWSYEGGNIGDCWYNLGNGNINFDCNDSVINTTNSTEGDNTWAVYVNHSSGSILSDSVDFYVDSLAPTITVTEPTTSPAYSGGASITVTASAFDSNLKEAWLLLYYITGGTPVSFGDLSIFSGQTLNGLNEGQYRWTVDAEDDYNHTSTSEGIIVLDNTPPQFSNILIDPTNNSNYSYSQSYDFDITWIDEVAGVDASFIEFNGENHTMNNDGNNYSLTLPSLAAGNYNYYFWANDSAGNMNVSDSSLYVINKADPIANLVSDVTNWTIELGTSIVINASENNLGDDDINYRIFVDETTELTSGVAWQPLSIGIYNISLNSSEGQNYSTVNPLDNKTLIVQDTIGPEFDLISSPLNNTAYTNGYEPYFEIDNVSDPSGIDECILYINNDSYNEWNNKKEEDGPDVAATSIEVKDVEGGEEGAMWIDFQGMGFDAGKYLWNITCIDNLGNKNATKPRFFTVLPNITFIGNYTNLTNVSDLSNVIYFYIENEFGKINFTQPIDFSDGVDWSAFLNLTFNSASVNGSSRFNTTAIIEFYNLSFKKPRILRDGEICNGVCVKLSYINNTLIFNVTGFSEYSSEETPVKSGGSSGSCTTDWECTDWSTCIDSVQTRTCSKVKPYCSKTTTDKPIESQECELEALAVTNHRDRNNESQPTSTSSIENSTQTSPPGITGAAIGANVVSILGIIIFLILFVVAYIFVTKKKNQTIEQKIKEEVAKITKK